MITICKNRISDITNRIENNNQRSTCLTTKLGKLVNPFNKT